MLTREQCERLEKAGFDRTIQYGEWYYPDCDGETVPHLYYPGQFVGSNSDRVKIPSTKELIEEIKKLGTGLCIFDRGAAWDVSAYPKNRIAARAPIAKRSTHIRVQRTARLHTAWLP